MALNLNVLNFSTFKDEGTLCTASVDMCFEGYLVCHVYNCSYLKSFPRILGLYACTAMTEHVHIISCCLVTDDNHTSLV